jgi:hypothetical protein
MRYVTIAVATTALEAIVEPLERITLIQLLFQKFQQFLYNCGMTDY